MLPSRPHTTAAAMVSTLVSTSRHELCCCCYGIEAARLLSTHGGRPGGDFGRCMGAMRKQVEAANMMVDQAGPGGVLRPVCRVTAVDMSKRTASLPLMPIK